MRIVREFFPNKMPLLVQGSVIDEEVGVDPDTITIYPLNLEEGIIMESCFDFNPKQRQVLCIRLNYYLGESKK
jgi:hypothetical protein|tara:strand:- start:344 stop:562 length:219 start_codon:yes stop_codon:yes gene_type:complete